MNRELVRIRDQIIKHAHLQAGQLVIDAGAGTGLLALEARRLVGSSGSVLAIDSSLPTLRMIPNAVDGRKVPVERIAADVRSMPIADAAVDAIIGRSVLMYVLDKSAVAREWRRVVRPNGRVVIYEPINSVGGDAMWDWGLDLAEIGTDHRSIMTYMNDTWIDRGATMGFDGQTLMRIFVDAGFVTVRLSYDHTVRGAVRAPALLSAWLRNRATGTMLSYEECAREVLGPSAETHMRRFDEIINTGEATIVTANACISAQG